MINKLAKINQKGKIKINLTNCRIYLNYVINYHYIKDPEIKKSIEPY